MTVATQAAGLRQERTVTRLRTSTLHLWTAASRAIPTARTAGARPAGRRATLLAPASREDFHGVRSLVVSRGARGCRMWRRGHRAAARAGARAADAWRAAAGGTQAARGRTEWRRVHGPPARHLGRARDSAQGRQRVRCRRGVAARRRGGGAGPLQPGRRSPGARVSGAREEGDLDCRPGLGAEGRERRLVPVARQDAARRGARPRGGAWCAARGTHRARDVGHDELRDGGGAGHRVRARRFPAAPEHRRRREAPARVLREVARQSALLVPGRRHAARGR